MTVIAWDGKTLAVDKQGSSNGTILTTTKIERLPDGTILACSGVLTSDLMMRKWYKEGRDPDKFPKCQADNDAWSIMVVVHPNGDAYYYCREPEPIRVEDSFFSWGSGQDHALGAMEMGADAVKAVEVASKWDNGCGRGCDFFTVKGDGHEKDDG